MLLTFISTGPYKYIRHPIYFVIIYFSLFLLLITDNLLVVFVQLFIIVIDITRMLEEEKIMKYTVKGYAEYACRTKRLIPLLF